MTTGSQRTGFASRFCTAALVVFGAWVVAHFGAMAYWFSTARGMRLITSTEIHTCELRLGYDLLSVVIAGALLTAFSMREHAGMIPRLAGVVLGASLAVAQIYYESCGAGHHLLPVFSGQWWAQKNAVAYSVVILTLLGVVTIVGRGGRSPGPTSARQSR